MKYRYILWDWNGTLLDDVEASLLAVNDILDKYGKKPITIDEYYSNIDTPIYKFYEKLFDLNVVKMEDIALLFREYYAKYDETVKIAKDAEKIICFCKEKGIKQYILSAAHIDNLTKYAKKYGVFDYFDRIEAAKDYEAGSKIERALRLFQEEKINPDECVMIGDTLHDLDTANALEVECVLYSKGHTDYDTLRETGKIVCSTFEEIGKVI